MTMIKSILIALAMITSTAFGHDTKKKPFVVPHDAVIKVYTKDGKLIGNMTRKEYKVVKLGTSKTKVVTKVVEKVREVPAQCKVQRNRLQLKLGAGKDGMKTRNKGDRSEVSERIVPVAGLGYSYELTDDLNLGVSATTNRTVTLDIGTDF